MTSPTSDRRQGLVGNTPIKAPVDCATTGPITLSGEQTIDGVLTSSSRVLVKNQTDQTQNGIYDTSSAAWTRSQDADGVFDLTCGSLVCVNGGATQSPIYYRLATANPVVIGTSALVWGASIQAAPVVATAQRENQTGANGQTVFTLLTMAYSYSVANSILVSVDGFLLPASEYTQTSANVVTLNTALSVPSGSRAPQVEFIAGTFTAVSNGKFSTTDTTSTSNDVGSYRFRRNVEYSGGTPGFVNSCIRADTFVDNAGATAFEWCGTFVLHNKATAGENVAIYGQGNKLSGAGPTWAAVLEVIDSSGGNPTTGAIGLEVDVRGDNGDASSNRVCIDVVATRTTGSVAANMTVGYGLRFQNGGDSTVTFSALIGVLPGTVAGIGIDLSGATTLAGALKMNQGVPIIFDNTGAPPKLTSQGLGLDHLAGSSLVNRLLATGGLQVATAQVVGPRVTGWALPTGTLARTTFDQSTVTLAQLAQRVAAIITDLYGSGSGHGLIGA